MNAIARCLALLLVLTPCLLAGGCGGEPDRLRSIEDLERQIERQIHDTRGLKKRPEDIRITRLRPSENGFQAEMELRWNRRITSKALVQFSTVSGRYALGTLSMPEIEQPVNLILYFP